MRKHIPAKPADQSRCTYPQCKCIVVTSTSNPEPGCAKGYQPIRHPRIVEDEKREIRAKYPAKYRDYIPDWLLG